VADSPHNHPHLLLASFSDNQTHIPRDWHVHSSHPSHVQADKHDVNESYCHTSAEHPRKLATQATTPLEQYTRESKGVRTHQQRQALPLKPTHTSCARRNLLDLTCKPKHAPPGTSDSRETFQPESLRDLEPYTASILMTVQQYRSSRKPLFPRELPRSMRARLAFVHFPKKPSHEMKMWILVSA
jgi:hypothetical protein